MHEVGHTLGLRHNFRASRVYTRAAARRPGVHEGARHHRLGDGVRADQPQRRRRAARALRHAVQRHARALRLLGDRVRLQAAAAGLSAADERAALEKIAGRSAEPMLAYGTDEDNFLGIDPETLQFDLGSDVIAFAKKRIAIAQELLKRQETRDAARRPGLQRPQALGQLRAARRRPRGQRAVAPDRRRPHGARRAGHRPRPADAGAGRRSSAKRSTSSPAACSRPTAFASRRRCSASSAPTSASAGRRCAAATARRRPTTRRRSRCSACSARCSR